MTAEAKSETNFELYPHFQPVFEIGKPLQREQMTGLVNWFKNSFWQNDACIVDINTEDQKIGFGITSEPTGDYGVPHLNIRRTRIPRNSELMLPLQKDHPAKRMVLAYKQMRELLTFTDNALSWNDSITITPKRTRTFSQKLELERNCDHDKKCSLGKKPIAKRVIDRITSQIS